MTVGNTASSHLGASIISTTSTDPEHPASAIIDDSSRQYWLTTGMFPQQVLIKLAEPTDLQTIRVHTHGAQRLTILGCDKPQPTQFVDICCMEMSGDREQSQSKEVVGKQMKYIMLRVDSGIEPFVAVHSLKVVGNY